MDAPLRRLWAEGRCARAAWVTINHPFVAESLARLGFDVLCLDLQHGLLTESDLLGMLQAVSQTDASALVRVASHDGALIGKALDLGAAGVIVPLVNTPDEAAAVVAACRYPPVGRRSYGPVRASGLYGSDYAVRANEAVSVFVMIETEEGLAHLEAICDTPGLTGVFIGPVDLSYALGLPPQPDNPHPDHVAAVTRILEACRRRGLVTGIFSDDPHFGRALAARGAHLVVVGTDARCLKEAASARLRAFDTPSPA
jgi:4-hydroxy-2-oxoheptanedioate aldolase